MSKLVSKLVPIEAEKRYIQLDNKLQALEAKHKIAKIKLLRYHAKGYTFSLIRPSDTSGGVFAPPWKKIAMELVKKLYKSAKERNGFFKSLIRRFPKTERAPKLCIIGKKTKEPVV
jgi:hypothetical protein